MRQTDEVAEYFKMSGRIFLPHRNIGSIEEI